MLPIRACCVSRIHYAPSHRPFFPSLCNLIKAAVTHLARVFKFLPHTRAEFSIPVPLRLDPPLYCVVLARECFLSINPVFEGHTVSARNDSRAVSTNFLTYRRLALKWRHLIARRHAKFNILFDPGGVRDRRHVFAVRRDR